MGSLSPLSNCECGTPEQTADHVLTACPIHRAPHRARGLTVLNNDDQNYIFKIFYYLGILGKCKTFKTINYVIKQIYEYIGVLRQLIERYLIERHLIQRNLIETTFD